MGADLYIVKLESNSGWGYEQSDEAVESGYFRDPYNNGSVLWKYDLSWWKDIIPLTDNESSEISVENTKVFLKMLEDKEDTFLKNIENDSDEWKEEFMRASSLLKKFLGNAIKLNSPIMASL